MRALWVDTDAGFDDLWALLLLRARGIDVAGVSLVTGNAPLAQVEANVLGAVAAYGFSWPVWRGAARPLAGEPITAARVLGPMGYRSRGRCLPEPFGADSERDSAVSVGDDAIRALRDWLHGESKSDRVVLCLGPLSNIATLVQKAPDAARCITRLVWMGGSNGPGNHTPAAEFNALADPHAVAVVLEAGLSLDIVDLAFCRQVTFDATDLAARRASIDPLTADLLGGYLDIALERGRSGMAIYDPLAALAASDAGRIRFERRRMTIETDSGEAFGATRFAELDRGVESSTGEGVAGVVDIAGVPGATGIVRLAVYPDAELASDCLAALSAESGPND